MRSCLLCFLCIGIGFLGTDCKKKDWREELEPVNWQVLHKDLIANRKTDFLILGGFDSKEKLLESWFQAIRKNPNGSWENFVLTENEYKEYFLPFTLGAGTSLDTTPLDSYWPIFSQRRAMALEKIVKTISSSDGKIQSIMWREGGREFGPWFGQKPDSIQVSKNGKTINIEEIKQVVKYKGKWKVAVLAP